MSNKHPPPPQPEPVEPLPTDPDRPTDPMPLEKDTGFNESHGYGPCHGGPSGPGDVASKRAATVVPNDADDSRAD